MLRCVPRAPLRAAAVILLALSGSAAAQAPRLTPADLSGPWIEATPDQVGMDAQRLEAAAARAASQPRARSLIVARHGRLVFERYFGGAGPETLFDVRSVTKSVVSLLLGIALRDGVVSGLDTSIAPQLSAAYLVDAQDAAITPRHLLTMTSGYAWNETTASGYNQWIRSADHVQYVLDQPHQAAPGTVFTYNSGAVHVLGVVVERAAGRPLGEYARERLFEPLGVSDVVWEPLERGTVNGGAGIDLRGRDLLKLGQLALQRGWSGERSVVPEEWIEQITRPAFSWRSDEGAQRSVTYGGLWWVSDAQPAAFFAWGYGGQFVYVVPSLDLTVVSTTNWYNLTEISPDALAEHGLGVIVEGVLPAVVAPER